MQPKRGMAARERDSRPVVAEQQKRESRNHEREEREQFGRGKDVALRGAASNSNVVHSRQYSDQYC